MPEDYDTLMGALEAMRASKGAMLQGEQVPVTADLLHELTNKTEAPAVFRCHFGEVVLTL